MYWYVFLTIVTIISFIFTFTFNLIFVYFPSVRAGYKFNEIYDRGQQVYDNSLKIIDDVTVTADALDDFSKSLCQGIDTNNGFLLQILNNAGTFDDFCQSYI